MGTEYYMKVGVLSDTHGLLRPEVIAALEGCDAIFHAGDIGKRSVTDELSLLAVVFAVRGNNDGAWAESIPDKIDINMGNTRVFMTHKKRDLPDDLSPYDLVIFGHSHKYESYRVGKTLVLNPGSCGPRRFNQPITLAVLKMDTEGIDVQRVDIKA